jgi:hypothetical protein
MKPHILCPIVVAGVFQILNAQPSPPPPLDPALEAIYQNLLANGSGHTPATVPRSPSEEKMHSLLASLFNADLRPAGVSDAAVKAEMLRLGQYQAGPPELAHVYVRVADGNDVANVLPFFHGEPVVMADSNMIAGWMPISDLNATAMLENVVFIDPVYPPVFRSGAFLTEGDALHNGPAFRNSLGLDGAPIRIGVISNGVTSLPAAQATSDLPPVNVLNVGMGDEGTAMLEIIHDIAPGADLSFCAAGGSIGTFQNAIAALHAQGCDIICDDVGWYTDPFFEHSPTGNLIGNLRTMRDYIHISACGNDGLVHHQQAFTDVVPAGGDGIHDQPLMARVPSGESLDIFFQWNEPQAGPINNNFDIHLFDMTGTTEYLPAGTNIGVNWDTIQFTNTTGSDQDVVLWIWRTSGSTTQTMEVFLEPSGPNGYVYSVGVSAADAIFGHPGHGSVIAVASTDWNTPNQLEINCSQGPFTILGPISAGLKPDVAAADGVTVSGVGGFGSPFYGTSAAAPHVAGVCALAWSKSPTLSATVLRNALRLPPYGATLDLPTTAPDGPDYLFGYGRPMADQWAAQLNGPPQASAPAGTIECAGGISEEIPGVSVSDPDAGAMSVSVTFSANFGMVWLDATISGGVQPSEVTANGSPAVTVTASLSAINTTLAAANGLRYVGNPVPPGPPQADTLAILVNDLGNSGMGGSLTGAAAVSLQVHQFAYYAWQYDKFDATERADPTKSGDDADPDGDLHTNVWEFFMGSDPKVADAAGEFSHSVSGTNFVFNFRVGPEINPVWYVVKDSQDLVNWNPLAPGVLVVNPHPTVPGMQQGVVTYPMLPGVASFLRVEFDPYQP